MELSEAKKILKDMEGRYYFIDNREETIERAAINEGTLRVVITTDFSERKCKLSELEEHLLIYKKEKNAPAKADSLQIVTEHVPVNKNLDTLEDMLMASIKKIRNGEKEHIPVAMATNKLALSVIAIQKTKVETGKLLLAAHKKMPNQTNTTLPSNKAK